MTIERATRRLTFVAGAGFVSFAAGAFVTALLTLQWGGALFEITSGPALLVVTAALQSIWVLVFLPFSGWLAGRYLHLTALRFALPSAMTGLFFELGLVTALPSSENVFLDWPEAIARVVFFAVGVILTMLAFKRATKAVERTQARAKALAEQDAQAYRAFADAEASRAQPPGAR